ncbi:hypothetical protein GCM10009808_07890 [Microbacterium sediminicola]|uniref:Uncharacterized protein n=2 Tax=Microbacterium sediminicola TaxID=415210 RepID=A0ABN2HTG8_9MICO
MLYVVLLAGVLVLNVALFAFGLFLGWWNPHAPSLQVIAAIGQANLVISSVPRQQWVVNVASWLATRPSTSWPLRIRMLLAKYYHVGGIHVGAALSGTAWYVLYIVLLAPAWADGEPGIDDISLGFAVGIVSILLLMVVCAMPVVRSKKHNLFEATHRGGAWAVLILAWVNVFLLARLQPEIPLGQVLMTSPIFWMVLASTAMAIWPWALLRKVPISVETPSSHVAIVKVHQKYQPPVGTTRAVALHPLQSWHPFACVPAIPGEGGYRMVVSRAGDWTSRFIENPPAHVWVRGLPTVGVANAKKLFNRVLYVTTGSGIGPALGHLLSDTQGSRLVWVTRNPRATYGDGLVDEVMRAQPEAVIWDTGASGKPDVFDVSYDAYRSTGADAVICVSNRPVTARVVGEFERRGIPAFGPIWDS